MNEQAEFRAFREKAKLAGRAVDQHAYQGPMFVFMTEHGALAVPAGREQVYQLLEFGDMLKFDLLKLIRNHHASENELESGSTPVIWLEFECERTVHDLWNDMVTQRPSNERREGDAAPPGRVCLSDWLE